MSLSATQFNNISPRSRWREAPLIQVRFGPHTTTASSSDLGAQSKAKPPLPADPPPVPAFTNAEVILEIYAMQTTSFNPLECDSLVLSCSPAFKAAIEADVDDTINYDRTRLAYEGTGQYWSGGTLESGHRVYVKETGDLYIYFSNGFWWLAPEIVVGEQSLWASHSSRTYILHG